MGASWLELARWAVGVASWKPTLAEAFAPTVISHEYVPAWRFTAPSVTFQIKYPAVQVGALPTC